MRSAMEARPSVTIACPGRVLAQRGVVSYRPGLDRACRAAVGRPTDNDRPTAAERQPQASTSQPGQADQLAPFLATTEIEDSYDMNIWHYKSWWCQPPMIVGTGVGIIVGANVLFEPGLHSTMLAAGPVFLWWYLFLIRMPSEFKQFATKYMKEHPELQDKDA